MKVKHYGSTALACMAMAHPARGFANAKRLLLRETPPVNLSGLNAELTLKGAANLADHGDVAGMPVDEHEVLKAEAQQGSHEILDHSHPGRGAQVKRAGVFGQ